MGDPLRQIVRRDGCAACVQPQPSASGGETHVRERRRAVLRRGRARPFPGRAAGPHRWGEWFVACFYDYLNLSPEEYVWPKEKYDRYSDEDRAEVVAMTMHRKRYVA
jgi:hypothetical protein